MAESRRQAEEPLLEETIAAIVTPLGPGGLGVVRLSGPGAFPIASSLFRSARPLADCPSHTLQRGVVHEDGSAVDEAVAALFRAPRSYTGEDVVELSCHGSPDVLRRVLELLLRKGARPAGPGEFTRRAYQNGKLDLAQAEAVAALVAARSAEARRWSLDQLQGVLSGRVEGLRKGLLDLLARLEAGLDFAEEEVPDLPRAGLSAGIEALRAEAAALRATAPRGRLFRDGFRVVLAGRPNAGKSSLFNALLGAERAIVTDVPGTTRDTLEETVLVDGLPVVLTDTAGLRADAGTVEAEGIARARRALEAADAALWVMDAADPFTAEDAEAFRVLAGKPVFSALSKADRLPPGLDRMALAARARELFPALKGPLLVSAKTGEGLPELRRLLASAAGPASGEAGAGPTLVSDRHEGLVREAEAALDAAARAAGTGEPDECVALELKRSLDALGQVTGRGVPDEVLDAVFARFCIGK